MATTTAQSVVIYLVRNDLRLHDNECLTWAQLNADVLVPLFCFDSNNFGRTASTWHYEFPKTGVHRTKFVLQSVANFQESLRDRGSDLVVRNGQTITTAVSEIIQLCQENSTGGKKKIALTFQKEITKEETDVEAELLKLCQEKEVEVKTFWGLTLYHLEDLPFTSIRALPDHYTAFRKQVESHSGVRQAVPSPETLKPMPEFIRDRVGVIPSLKELTSNSETLDTPDDTRSAFPFVGGETAALERVERYLWGTDNVSSYKETRNGLVGAEYSTKFSPWLALGCLSPRKIYERIKKYEKERQKNDSTYWVIFELIWRDYFKFVSLKYGDKVFFLSGIMGKKGLPWKRDMTLFDRWRYGKTGVPFVDANMRELLLTGWMSNRGRQNVASFLVKDLGLDWRLGAEWFESLLIDHDVCSNYGNWNYSAGIGNDPRDARKFNMIKQALDYDPEGEYVRLWVPELAGLKAGKVHAPWTLSSSELKVASVNLGESYPRPITVQTEWSRHYSKLKGARWNERTPKRGIDFYFKSATGSSR